MNRKKLIILIALYFVLYSNCCYSQWVQQYTGLSTPIYNIQFVNRYTGWATGSNSVILKTTDAGATWMQQNAFLSQAKTLYGLSMVNASVGYIAGNGETILKLL